MSKIKMMEITLNKKELMWFVKKGIGIEQKVPLKVTMRRDGKKESWWF